MDGRMAGRRKIRELGGRRIVERAYLHAFVLKTRLEALRQMPVVSADGGRKKL
jgi:hypothetical protein